MLLNVVTSTNILAAAALRLTCYLLTQFLLAHLPKALDLKTLLLIFGRSVLLSHPVLKLYIETATASLHWVIAPNFLQRMPSEISVAKEQSITTNTNKLILYRFGVSMLHRFEGLSFYCIIHRLVICSWSRPLAWAVRNFRYTSFAVRLTRLQLDLK